MNIKPRSWRWLTLLVLIASLVTACADEDNDNSTNADGADMISADATQDVDDANTTQDTAQDDTSAAQDTALDTGGGLPTCDLTGANDDLIIEGDYFLSLSLTPLGGLLVNSRVHIVAASDRILSVEMWSLSPDLTWESEAPVGRVCDVPVVDGAFSVVFDSLTVPPRGTTANVPATIEDFTLNGDLLDNKTFCGTSEGYVPLLQFPLDGSPFRGVPFGEQTNPPMSSCEMVEAVLYDPITTCPTLSAGVNGMTSAELNREFTLTIPSGADATPLPLVFLYHGLGDSSSSILNYSSFGLMAESESFILITPSAAPGGQFPVDWNSLAAQYDTDNQDLVFFDDMLKCASEQYPIDPDRVYVTGMSAGGIWSTFLGLHRADVIAAIAPMSGGYLQTWPDAVSSALPWMVSWGGTTDFAYDLNFHESAQSLIENLSSNGNSLVSCDHDAEHTWPTAMSPAIWAFLSSFTLGQTEDPFANGLPAAFPSYCSIIQ